MLKALLVSALLSQSRFGGVNMNWKKLCKAILFPHIAIMLFLLPLATALLVYSMVFLGTDSIVSIISYVLAFYTLTIWVLKVMK